jgi:hypothetical protein
MSSDDEKQQQVILVDIIRQTIKRDEALREKYDIKNKFRFVRDRLQTLLANLEKDLQLTVDEEAKHADIVLAADEVFIYVYLFNAHGATLRTWQNMLIPKVFYEYSVNRPIYAEKQQVESVVHSKSNKAQHAYLTIAIKTADIIKSATGTAQKDGYGNITLKIKEGSLHFAKLSSFTHNELNYYVNEKGELIKKT